MPDNLPDPQNIVVDREGGVLCLSIDRVSKRNVLDFWLFDVMARELADADADSDASLRSVFLFGAGGGFAAGHDLDAYDGWSQGLDDPVPRFLHALAALRKPLMIAVHGWAVGRGAPRRHSTRTR